VGERIVAALVDARLLDDLGDGTMTIHEIDENRPKRYPSDAPEATRQRQQNHRARLADPVTTSRVVTRDLGDGYGYGSISGEGESEGKQAQPSTTPPSDATTTPEHGQPDVTELHPITRSRKPRAAGPVPVTGPTAPTEPPRTPRDPFDEVYGPRPKATTQKWHKQLVTTYGPQEVASAMHRALQADPDPGTLLSRTEAILRADKAGAIDAATSAAIDAAMDAQRRKWQREQEAADRDAPKVEAMKAATRAQLFGEVDRASRATQSATRKATKQARVRAYSTTSSVVAPVADFLDPSIRGPLPPDVSAQFAPAIAAQ
jgi:hypothetical protein